MYKECKAQLTDVRCPKRCVIQGVIKPTSVDLFLTPSSLGWLRSTCKNKQKLQVNGWRGSVESICRSAFQSPLQFPCPSLNEAIPHRSTRIAKVSFVLLPHHLMQSFVPSCQTMGSAYSYYSPTRLFHSGHKKRGQWLSNTDCPCFIFTNLSSCHKETKWCHGANTVRKNISNVETTENGMNEWTAQ